MGYRLSVSLKIRRCQETSNVTTICMRRTQNYDRKTNYDRGVIRHIASIEPGDGSMGLGDAAVIAGFTEHQHGGA
jgi:hypothetical protein